MYLDVKIKSKKSQGIIDFPKEQNKSLTCGENSLDKFPSSIDWRYN